MKQFNFDQPFVVVGGLLEKEGKYLLVKEADGPEKGKWNLPAGRWDAGETLVEGAEREVGEETGFKFSAEKLLGAYIRNRGGNSVLILIFRGKFIETSSKIENDIEETKWFSREEIDNMSGEELRFEGLASIIDEYLEGKEYSLEFSRVLK